MSLREAGRFESVMIVLATLVGSLMAVAMCLGLLEMGGAGSGMKRAGVLLVCVSLAIGQGPAANELARRMNGRLSGGRAVSLALLVSSVVLLAMALAVSFFVGRLQGG